MIIYFLGFIQNDIVMIHHKLQTEQQTLAYNQENREIHYSN
jgi:hypothetical protein